jgi:hypothetical protein
MKFIKVLKNISRIPKDANLEIILDSCHSGTGARELTAIKNLPLELSFKHRFMYPPADIAHRDDDEIETNRFLRKASQNPMNHVLFAACRDNQTSADAFIGGNYNGAFKRKTMSKKEDLIERNIELSAEFSRYLFEHPELEEKIPMNAEIILLPEFDQELKKFNLRIGKEMEEKGEKVIFIAIKDLKPKMLSRIGKIELEAFH